MLPLVELDSIESDALVAKEELILCQKSVENHGIGEIKARLVAIGRTCCSTDTFPYAAMQVVSAADARIVPTTVTACGRETNTQ